MKTVPVRGRPRTQHETVDRARLEAAKKRDLREIVDLANSGIPLTLEQCSILLGVSRQWVSAMEKRAKEKLLVALQETPE